MGWFGYGIYDGDGTSTCFYDFNKFGKLKINEDLISEEILTSSGKIKLSNDYQKKFLENINLIISNMPKLKKDKYKDYLNQEDFRDEDDAIEWQMLLAVFVDNNMKVPKIVLENGVKGTQYLMGQHAEDFDSPYKRRKKLKTFIEKSKKLKVLK